MKAIVAVDNNWGIGFRGELLTKIPDDMKHFKKMTMGKVVVMGRKTYESIGKPLIGRINVVLSNGKFFQEGNVVAGDLETVKQYDSDDMFVIGGQSVYEQLIDYCDTVYVTKIDEEYEADRFFPNIDEDESWYLFSESDVQMSECGLEFRICEYRRG